MHPQNQTRKKRLSFAYDKEDRTAVYKHRTSWENLNSQWFHNLFKAQIWYRTTFGCFQKWGSRKVNVCFQWIPKFRQPCSNGYAANQSFSMDGMKQLIEQLSKYVAVSGGYVEK
ncbi:hypothetical protein TNCV_3721781 [Trichonephila clavipes]|nr:hypothetical protein TNCV_3721781 [Trichonephila clavipes]